MIGLSLSLCVRDIIAGRVNPVEVSLIVADIKAATDEQFHFVLDRYAENYWRENPNYGKALANKLREQGRLIQPRLLEQNHEHNIANGWWVLTNGNFLLDRWTGFPLPWCDRCKKAHPVDWSDYGEEPCI
jgi:hypothetical protein